MNCPVINSINKLPIVIVANYRTGSSALGQYLAKYHNVDWLPEPYHHPDNASKLQQNYINNTGYVTKFIVDQIPNLEIHQKVLSSDCFKIRLVRDNLAEQVASYYIASSLNKWRQHEPVVPEYSIPLNIDKMSSLAKIIIDNNALLKNLDIKFDLDLSYENLNFNPAVKHFFSYKTTLPTNIIEIIELANTAIISLQKSSFRVKKDV